LPSHLRSTSGFDIVAPLPALERLFERLLALRNDLGLLSEEYDPQRRRLIGNFPQAFSHVPLVNTAHNLGAGKGPSQHRAAVGRTGRDGTG
jgi:GH15 family glucan-1,4-alpha-glucosidase